jgi:hypothetical protein
MAMSVKNHPREIKDSYMHEVGNVVKFIHTKRSEKISSKISLLGLLCFNVTFICNDKLKCLRDLFVHLAVVHFIYIFLP